MWSRQLAVVCTNLRRSDAGTHKFFYYAQGNLGPVRDRAVRCAVASCPGGLASGAVLVPSHDGGRAWPVALPCRAAVGHERAEHVLVCLTVRLSEDAAPGLLLGWRERKGKGWDGWVITAEPSRDGQSDTLVRQLWVTAS